MIYQFEKKEAIENQSKPILIILSALLLALAILNLQHKTKTVIPQAIELQWAADSTWTKGGWE